MVVVRLAVPVLMRQGLQTRHAFCAVVIRAIRVLGRQPRPLQPVPLSCSTSSRAPVVLATHGDEPYTCLSTPVASLLGLQRMALLGTVAPLLQGSLDGVVLRKCTVSVAFSASREEPTPAEEAAAVGLKGATELRDLAERHPGMNVYLRIHSPVDDMTGTRLQLPAPVTFIPTLMGDTTMVKTVVQTEDVPQPFFLSQLAYDQLLKHFRLGPSRAPQLLVLIGPFKCGKTSVPFEVLPAMVANEYRASARGERPLFVRFTCPPEPPSIAAMTILNSLADAASACGINVARPADAADALFRLGEQVGTIATQMKKQQRQLWLLLDESQAPILASPTAREASSFVNALKSVVSACSMCARVVVTGSGMVTLLNQMRMLPMNGFELMTVAKFVQLGSTPSLTAAVAMTEEVLEWHARRLGWSEAVRTDLTATQVVSQVAAYRGWLSPRPALISYLASNVDSSPGADPPEALQAALRATMHKLRTESQGDFLVALERLSGRRDAKVALYALATGIPKPLTVLRDHTIRHPDNFKAFASLLCEPTQVSGGGGSLQLLPPYAELCKEFLNPDGDQLLYLGNTELQLGSSLRSQLIFFQERYREGCFDASMQRSISNEVLRVLAANGVGMRQHDGTVLPVNADAIDTVQELKLLLRSRYTTAAAKEYDLSVKARTAAYLSSIGLHVLRWARHVASHDDDAATAFSEIDIPAALLDKMLRAAIEAVLAQGASNGFVFTPGGDDSVPRVTRPPSGPPQAVP